MERNLLAHVSHLSMEGNTMSTEEIDLPHQEGPSWDIVGKYATYEAADIKRNELLSEENLQVKIHYQGPRNRKLLPLKKNGSRHH